MNINKTETAILAVMLDQEIYDFAHSQFATSSNFFAGRAEKIDLLEKLINNLKEGSLEAFDLDGQVYRHRLALREDMDRAGK
jgi:hypothetical protein